MKQISDICSSNADTLNEYLQEMNHEGLARGYRSNAGLWVGKIAEYCHKPYKKMVRNDILSFLDRLQKSEDIDPLHKWIGTYNYVRIHLMRFFRWLYNPSLPPPRPKPKVVENIPTKRRREQSIYKPDDLWTQEDASLFLKYAKNSRDSCYVAMALDLSARPDELLKLRIKDVVFKRQYAHVLVNGKTGSRSVVLIDSIPYVKAWISQHPQRNDQEAILLCSGKQRRKMNTRTLDNIFSKYQSKYFPALMKTDIPMEDRVKIKELLKKPFNPYIFRHTSLTNKSKLINEVALRQDAGWARKSQMHLKYVHYYGNEATNAILKARGIIPDSQQDTRLLSKPKECPNCSELNEPLGKFCIKCKMALRYEGVAEVLEAEKKKDQEIHELKERMDKMGEIMIELDAGLRTFRHEFQEVHLTDEKRERLDSRMRLYREGFMSYINKFHPPEHPFSEQERKRLKEIRKQIDALPPEADEYIPE
jgi:integrase/recombinase XerD